MSETFDSCTYNPNWNAWHCRGEALGVLHFQSEDDDKGKRNIYPVYLKSMSGGEYVNKLNQFMEHTCDGIYPGLFRLSRFPALVGLNDDYDISFTGSVPKSLSFKLQAANGVNSERNGVMIQIRYNAKGTWATQDAAGELIEGHVYDPAIDGVPELTKGTCGENRYLPVENTLQFWIEPGCMLTVVPLDVIRARIRMQWTLEEFYADGGSTAFVDRLAGSLGIHSSTIKVVTVYEGSVVVEFEIIAEDADGSDAASELAAVEELLEELLADESLDLGVTVISASINEEEVDFYTYEEGLTEDGVTYGNTEEVTDRYKGSKSSGGIGTLGYVVICLCIVLLATIMGMAYMYVKGKQAQQERKAVDVEDGNNTSPSMSEASEQFEKQFVPSFDGGKTDLKDSAPAKTQDADQLSN